MGIAVMQGRTGQQMSAEAFRDLQKRRPDHERWELLAGVPVMMTPPTLSHNHIASNLQQLLNMSFARKKLAFFAVQRPGFRLAVDNYQPEPDVAVINADYEDGQRYIDGAHLLAEVVSSSDQIGVPGDGREWIEVKCELYRGQASCSAILVIVQDRMEVQLDMRAQAGWSSTVLSGADAEIVIPGLDLSCRVADLYAGTPLSRRA